jgi:hypothetical protein
MRSRYDLTVANLRSQFESDELLLLFYENLFSEASIESICRFLEVDFTPADFSGRLNDAPDSTPIDADFRAAARDHLDVVYEFCADQFGRETIRSLWRCY